MFEVSIILTSVVLGSMGLVIKKLFSHEHRLTRIETKLDLWLERNGINPKDCIKEVGRGKKN